VVLRDAWASPDGSGMGPSCVGGVQGNSETLIATERPQLGRKQTLPFPTNCGNVGRLGFAEIGEQVVDCVRQRLVAQVRVVTRRDPRIGVAE